VRCLAPFMKEGFVKGVRDELRNRQDATSRYLLSALILGNDNVLVAIRRELRRVVDVLVRDDEILKVLRDEVIKRETMDGPEAEAAARRISRIEQRSLHVKASAEATTETSSEPSISDDPPAAKRS